MSRDNFTKKNSIILSERAALMCSNPNCRILTSGPHSVESKSLKNGVAAHIHAATSGGPRYNPNQSKNERSCITNGIWLCHNCSDLVDKDPQRYTSNILFKWKKIHEKFVNEIRKVENAKALNQKKFSHDRTSNTNEKYEMLYKNATGAQLRFLLILREAMRFGSQGMDCGYVSNYFQNIIKSQTDRYDGWITPFITGHLQGNEIVKVADNYYTLTKFGEEFLKYIEKRNYPLLEKKL